MDRKLLIELVKHEAPLWDQRHKNYHNRDIRPALWDKIGEKLNVAGREAQKTWESLRDMYRRHLKETGKLKVEDDPKLRNRWKYFETMDFLRDVTTTRRSSAKLRLSEEPTLSPPALEEESPIIVEENTPIIIEDGEYLEENTTRLETHDPSNISSVEEIANEMPRVSTEHCSFKSKGKKRALENEAPEMEPRKIQVPVNTFEQNSVMSEDEDYLFLKSLLPSIKKLGDVEKMYFRMDILSALTKRLEKRKRR